MLAHTTSGGHKWRGQLRNIITEKGKKKEKWGVLKAGPARCKHATDILTYTTCLRQAITNRTLQNDDSNAEKWHLEWRAWATAGSHELIHETTYTQRHIWLQKTQSSLDLRPQADTNPKWQGGLIISADLPAIICGPTRDFMRDFLMMIMIMSFKFQKIIGSKGPEL